MRKLVSIVFIAVVPAMTACNGASPSTPGAPASGTATMVMFVEQEPGIDPYPTRVLVTEKALRFDDGEGADAFVLFDREARTIYSVSSNTRSVMVVEPRAVDIEPPYELKVEETHVAPMANAPKIGGQTPEHFQYSANGELCYDVIAVEGLMDDMVAAMREFREVLAGDSALTFNAVPADLQTPCDIALSTFAPTRHLQRGFPIQEWDPRGYTRSLVEFDEAYAADAELFELPGDYTHYTVQQLREGTIGLQL